jgi:hypothetical protein
VVLPSPSISAKISQSAKRGAGGSRERPFDELSAAQIFRVVKRMFAKQSRDVINAYANGRNNAQLETVVTHHLLDEIARHLRPAFFSAAKDGINKIATISKAETPQDLTAAAHDKAKVFAADQSKEMIAGVNATTEKAVEAVTREGGDTEQMFNRLATANVFSDRRAEMIAKTEISHAQNAGMLEAGKLASDSGRRIKKVWTLGPDPCDECVAAAAVADLELDAAYDNVGSEAPPLHPNCMCTLELIDVDAAVGPDD